MSKLDDIVSSVDADWWIDGQASYEEGMDAQRELKEAIKTFFKELIGKETPINYDMQDLYNRGQVKRIEIENSFKKRLRQKVDEL